MDIRSVSFGPRTLIECQEVAGQMCMPTITVACDPDGGGAWSFPNTCLPDGWMECDPPAEGACHARLARAHEADQIQLVGPHARRDSSTEKNSG